MTYVFLGLDSTDTVEQDIQTSGEDSLVFGGPGHCVGLTGGGDSIGKQQAYNTTNPKDIFSWIQCSLCYLDNYVPKPRGHPLRNAGINLVLQSSMQNI